MIFPLPQPRLGLDIGRTLMPRLAQGYGLRPDRTKKGRGFLGPLKTKDGKTMTELSIGIDFGKGETLIPTIVPSLTKEELEYLKGGGEPTKEIINKAVEHAIIRMNQGLSPFFSK